MLSMMHGSGIIGYNAELGSVTQDWYDSQAKLSVCTTTHLLYEI